VKRRLITFFSSVLPNYQYGLRCIPLISPPHPPWSYLLSFNNNYNYLYQKILKEIHQLPYIQPSPSPKSLHVLSKVSGQHTGASFSIKSHLFHQIYSHLSQRSYAVLLPNCNLIPHKHAKGLYVEFLSFTYNLSYLLPPHLNMSLIVNNGLLIPSLWLLRAFAADTLNGAKFLNLEYQIKKFLCSGYSKRYSKSRIQENLGSNTLN
jgi:hypothetical protein